MKSKFAVVAAVVALGALSACGNGSSASSGAGKTLTVSAAASLTESFDKIKDEFMAAHPGTQVRVNYDGSSTLVQQITAGGPADVFASADQKNMAKLVKAKLADGTPQVFASNVLEIAVPPKNPQHIKTLKDLARPGTEVVLCAPQVPCGSAAKKVEQKAGITIKPRSEEQNVKAVLTKVRAGEADAGLVYVTDVLSAKGKVTGIKFPESSAAVNEYPISVVKGSKNASLAKQFIDFVRSAKGKAVLTSDGFTAK
jgi:molybdate transport system substrate-binding protein